jgi:hypothetical protein
MAELPALDVSQDTLYTLLSLYLKILVRRWRSTGSSAEVVYRI